jgi:peptidoglycan/LPS O-acetylase OafA/YrhL
VAASENRVGERAGLAFNGMLVLESDPSGRRALGMTTLGELFATRESNNFNLIRVLAAAVVIFGHAPVVVGAGEQDFITRTIGIWCGGIAVDLFFSLSGFLVVHSIVTRGAFAYTTSRLLRIFPALIVCMAVSAFLLPLLFASARDSGAWAYFWGNATTSSIQWAIPGLFEAHPSKVVNGSIWSVFIEVRCYAALLIAFLVGALQNRSAFNALFATLLIGGFLFPQLEIWPLSHTGDRPFMAFFLMGTFFYMNRDAIPMNPLLALTALAAIAATRGTPQFPIVYTLALPYLLFTLAFVPGLSWYDRMGDYSYGLYLYGWPAQQVVLALKPGMSIAENQIYAGLLALACAALSWHFIEKSALALKGRIALARKQASLPAYG